MESIQNDLKQDFEANKIYIKDNKCKELLNF